MKLDNLHDHDTVLCIDGADDNRHGSVGLGKSNLVLAYMFALNPYSTIANNLVIGNDYEHYTDLLNARPWYTVVACDEWEWFVYKRTSMHGTQKDTVREFMSNRKERKFHIGALPRIWDVDKVILKERIKWRLRVEDRGRASLHMRNAPSKWDKKTDLWGLHIGTFTEIPRVPWWLWNEYQRCLKAYRPAETDRTGKMVIRPVKRAHEIVCEPEQPLSPEGYTNGVSPTGDTGIEKGE